MAKKKEPPCRGQIDAALEAERRRVAEEEKDVYACRQLWQTVLERTVDDIHTLRRYAAKKLLKKHEADRLRDIQDWPPEAFVCGPWFEQVCDYLQVNPEVVRAAILEIEADG